MSGRVGLLFNLVSISLELVFLSSYLPSAGATREDEHGVTRVVVAEGRDVILPCSLTSKENIESKLFDWKKAAQKDERIKEVFLYDASVHYNNGRTGQSEEFKGRVSHFQDQLKYGNASIIIRNTKMTDHGNYTCFFPLLQPHQMFYVELVVDHILKDRSGENLDVAPMPQITVFPTTEEWILLQCVVGAASPKPTIQWQDSAGNILPVEDQQVSKREDIQDIMIQTVVTETDNYRCVVTQETIGHQIYAETFVHISKKLEDSCYNKIIGSLVGGFFLGAVIGAAIALLVARTFYEREKRFSCDSSLEKPLKEPHV